MFVRLTRHWNGFKPGRVFAEMPDGMANMLIRRGFAEQPAEQAKDREVRKPAKHSRKLRR